MDRNENKYRDANRDPITGEDEYWKSQYHKEPYYTSGLTYDDYAPAYRTGYTGRARFAGRTFDEVQDDLRTDYERNKGRSKLTWEQASRASRAAWARLAHNSPQDSD